MKHGSLFSGIGGFDLAAEWMGWENVFHCEWNDFGQKVLKHYWPNAESYGDITKTDFTKWRGTVDIISGGFPCQPYSNASSNRRGKEDERHLWPHMLRTIQEIQPRFVVGENVRGLVNWNGGLVFNEVHSDLELAGYDVAAFLIPAAAVNAPHGRDRVWFVAKNTSGIGLENRTNETGKGGNWKFEPTSSFGQASEAFGNVTDTNGDGSSQPNWDNFPIESPLCGGDDGLPRKLDGITFSKWRAESIKGYGNAIVPQVAYQIFKTIQISL